MNQNILLPDRPGDRKRSWRALAFLILTGDLDRIERTDRFEAFLQSDYPLLDVIILPFTSSRLQGLADPCQFRFKALAKPVLDG